MDVAAYDDHTAADRDISLLQVLVQRKEHRKVLSAGG